MYDEGIETIMRSRYGSYVQPHRAVIRGLRAEEQTAL
jgi:hypothetical protein